MEKLVLSNERIMGCYPFEPIELNHTIFKKSSIEDNNHYNKSCKEIIPDIKSDNEIRIIDDTLNFIKNDTQNKETIKILNLLVENKDNIRYITDGSYVAFYVVYETLKEQFSVRTEFNCRYPGVINDIVERFNKISTKYEKIKFIINTFGTVNLRNLGPFIYDLSTNYDPFRDKYNVFDENVITGKRLYLWCENNKQSIFDDERDVANKILGKYFSNGKRLGKFKKYNVINKNGEIFVYLIPMNNNGGYGNGYKG